MAKKKTSSCLIGCGLGCLILLILGIALFAGGAWWIRDMMGGFEDAVEARDSVEERFGKAADFTPAPDGSIAPDRVEAFLAIRQETADSRAKIGAFFEALPLSEEEARELEEQAFFDKMNTVLGITSSAFGLAGTLGDFYRARNSAFIRLDMGLGEYSYIYVLAYYSWLGKSPEDGPGDEDVVDGDFQHTYRRVRRNFLSNLENQLASLDQGGDAVEAEASGLRRALSAELTALRDDRYRIPWEDGLPPAIEHSLRPYRDRLEAAYDETTNPFELARMEKRGRFSIQAN